LVSTTRFESFGLTLVEAARTQTGIVGMRAPGVTETLPESSGGAVYFKSLRGLSRYLHFESNLEQFENLGKNAANYVEKTYDFDKISMIWRQVLLK
jgi:glycosyltransferase involved in cell wall biosynthesis